MEGVKTKIIILLLILLSALWALPVQATTDNTTFRQFDSVQEVRDFARGLQSYEWAYTDSGKVCRHVAGEQWRAITEAGYFAGIMWSYERGNPKSSHWEVFTFVRNRAYTIDFYGNVNPTLGWENFKFDW